MKTTHTSYFPVNPYKTKPGELVQDPFYRRQTAACGGREIGVVRSWLEFAYFEFRACGLLAVFAELTVVILASATLIVGIELFYSIPTTFASEKGTHAEEGHSIPDKPAREKPVIIREWDNGPKISFSNCRENEKHHISCQWTDSEGTEHWICINGLTEKDMK